MIIYHICSANPDARQLSTTNTVTANSRHSGIGQIYWNAIIDSRGVTMNIHAPKVSKHPKETTLSLLYPPP
jgi:hypothetical protein